MSSSIHVSQIVSRVRSGVSDMSYAQRRVFENRTGIAAGGREHRSGPSGPCPGREPVIASSVSELEALYAQDLKTGWR
jgi:hypothetical protein